MKKFLLSLRDALLDSVLPVHSMLNEVSKSDTKHINFASFGQKYFTFLFASASRLRRETGLLTEVNQRQARASRSMFDWQK